MILVIFVDLAYSEHEETEMLAVFTYANELGFYQALTHLRSEIVLDTRKLQPGSHEKHVQITFLCYLHIAHVR